MPVRSNQKTSPLRILVLLTGMALAASGLSLFASWHWLPDLLANFRVYYFIFLAPAAIGLFLGKRYFVASLALAFALLHFWVIGPYYWDRPPAPPPGLPVLKVASINVLTSNPDFQKVIDAIRAEDPDIVFLMEINEAWKKRLEPLLGRWPYVLAYPQEDNFGVMFLSKIPWDSARSRLFGEAGVRSIEARFQWKGHAFALFGIHPVPPAREEGTRFRNEQIAAVAEEVLKEKGPVIVAGDFNATPWSFSFGDFIGRTGLRDAALGFGIQNTWRNETGFVRIPIDHVCISKGIGIRSFRVGPDIGSDHYPVFTELVFLGN